MKKKILFVISMFILAGVIVLGLLYVLHKDEKEQALKKGFREKFEYVNSDMIRSSGKKFISESGYEFEFVCYCYDEYTRVAYLEIDVRGEDFGEEELNSRLTDSAYYYGEDKYFCITASEYGSEKMIFDYEVENGVMKLFYYIPFDVNYDDKFDGTVFLYDVKKTNTEAGYDLEMTEFGKIKMKNTCNEYYEENGLKMSCFGMIIEEDSVFPIVEYYGERISVIDVLVYGEIDGENNEYEKLDEHIKKYSGDADNEDDFSIYKIVEGKDVRIFKYPVDIDKITYLGKK